MLDALRGLAARIVRCDRAVRAVRSRQVQQKALKEEARGIVDCYFREVRERMILGGVLEGQLSRLDSEMQGFLDISAKSSTVTTYRSRIRSLRGELRQLEKLALTTRSTSGGSALDPTDELIVRTLAGLIPSAARSYEQAIRDLRAVDRLSWRGPAADLRESLRETLDHLAPDADVMAKPAFKLEKEAKGPTMKQKVRYILRSRGASQSQAESSEDAVAAVDEVVGSFVRSVYTRSTVSTHTPTDRNEILRIRDWVRVALCELLEIRGAV